MTDQMSVQDGELRQLAITRLNKKRDFGRHTLAYLLVNTLLVVIWLLTDPGGFFWPVFPLFGWGIGLAFHAWDTFAEAPSEEKIRTEMQRLSSR